MTTQPKTNFRDSNNVDLGKKLVTKDYLLDVYGEILNSLGNSSLTVTPTLWSWGNAFTGTLGAGNNTSRSTPVTTLAGGTNWKQVSAGSLHTSAIKTDGTLWVWGGGQTGVSQFGQLGVNDITNRNTPVTTILGGTNWKQVSAGANITAAIKTDGSLWTWGLNDFGQLGVNDNTSRSTPVTTLLGGTNWKTVSAGYRGITAIKTDGSLWIWGTNGGGRLGVNDTTNRSTPVTTLAGGNDWKSSVITSNMVMAIKTDGTLWTWGIGNNGRLGVNDNTNRLTPVTTILGGNNWKSLSSGQSVVSIAIKTDGTLWTWGQNVFGQLGVNDITDRSTPVTTILGGTDWKTIGGGNRHTTVIKTDGSLWIWGSAGAGRLGINDTEFRSTPVTTILGGNNWKQVSGGYLHTAAIQSIDYI